MRKQVIKALFKDDFIEFANYAKSYKSSRNVKKAFEKWSTK